VYSVSRAKAEQHRRDAYDTFGLATFQTSLSNCHSYYPAISPPDVADNGVKSIIGVSPVPNRYEQTFAMRPHADTASFVVGLRSAFCGPGLICRTCETVSATFLLENSQLGKAGIHSVVWLHLPNATSLQHLLRPHR
jgi:hypothetical protein